MEGLLLIILCLQGAFGATLLEFGSSRTMVSCCNDNMTLLCESIHINTEALGVEDLELPNNITVQFSNLIPGDNDGYHYMSEQAEAVLTFNKKTNGLFGHVSSEDGRSYIIEDCGKEGHVFKEIDVSKFGEDVAKVVNSTNDADKLDFTNLSSRQGQMPTFSVKVYYTPEFAASIPNVDGYIKQVITETNQGYMNSRVNLRVKLHCTEMATIHEQYNADTMIRNFENMKGSVKRLRGSADAAVLLTADLSHGSCGLAYFNTLDYGGTVSVVKGSCALGYFSFGHEIGHNIGLGHNKEVRYNYKYPYAHGHLIAPGKVQWPKHRTILAYGTNGHIDRQNYYSNPRINFPLTGTPLGVEGVADNARLLNERGAYLARIGDESESCRRSRMPRI